jgi:hypothetical protein
MPEEINELQDLDFEEGEDAEASGNSRTSTGEKSILSVAC